MNWVLNDDKSYFCKDLGENILDIEKNNKKYLRMEWVWYIGNIERFM